MLNNKNVMIKACGLSGAEIARAEFATGLKGLVFDIDGVLFDSRTSNIEYYNIIRRAVKMPPLNDEEADYCHQASVHESLEKIIPPAYREAAHDACRKLSYTEQVLPMLALEPGLLETLHWLRSWNVRLAIFTNRSNSVDKMLHYFGLDEFFFPVKTVANCLPKPNPDGLFEIMAEWNLPASAIAFLGDSSVDEQAARKAGVPFWAFRNPALVARLHFTDYFSMISMIAPLVEHLH